MLQSLGGCNPFFWVPTQQLPNQMQQSIGRRVKAKIEWVTSQETTMKVTQRTLALDHGVMA